MDRGRKLEEQFDISSIEQCDCLPDCNLIDYSVEISYAQSEFKKDIREFEEYLNQWL